MMRVLVIEDNPFNLELFQDLLEVAGHTVFTSMDAEAGIAQARQSLPDIIVMDIGLPGMDGLQAVRLLRQDDRTKGITVVAVTAHAMKEDGERVRAAGCDGYITKPVNTRTFVSDLEAHLADSQNPTQPAASADGESG